MNINKALVGCLAVLASFAIAVRSARASGTDHDCTTSLSACGFGTQVSGPNGSASGTLTGSGHDISFSEAVYENGSGVYTYIFSVTNKNSLAFDYAIAHTLGPSGTENNFNCPSGGAASCLSYGVVNVTGFTTSTGIDDSGFQLGSLGLTVNINPGVGLNQTFSFYVQSMLGPAAGNFLAGNNGNTSPGAAIGAPEPGVLTLLGSLLLAMLLGLPFASRRRAVAA